MGSTLRKCEREGGRRGGGEGEVQGSDLMWSHWMEKEDRWQEWEGEDFM